MSHHSKEKQTIEKILAPQIGKLMKVIQLGRISEQELQDFIKEVIFAAYIAGKRDVLKEMEPGINKLRELKEMI